MDVVNFTQMKDGTREEYQMLRKLELEYASHAPKRLLTELAKLEDDTLPGYKITRLDHALQAATRAYREGADIDWIVSALLHDIGDALAPMNHDRFSAEIIRPFVREECSWTVEHHGSFQMIYYGHHLDWDPNVRDAYRDSIYFQTCADFCERWDQSSFDPGYETEPLSFFEPMVDEVFARKPWSEEVLRKGVVVGLPVVNVAQVDDQVKS
ncbi:HD domain-containing protein [Ochrobactrum sp. C6C9]|uniref:HD domain-containing protein n=1 Tax=Ochrobactrum sp. C6C9 TaxID=2736662 RepID=UPI0035304589|nr:HD domain-containing protein [Ochrobactrum sp. C6C9]